MYATGFELILYGASMRALLRKPRNYRNKTDKLYMLFSTVLLVLGTINLAANCVFGEIWWISNQNYPGGSEEWFGENAAVWYQTMASAANVLVQLLADALLVMSGYRLPNKPLTAIV